MPTGKMGKVRKRARGPAGEKTPSSPPKAAATDPPPDTHDISHKRRTSGSRVRGKSQGRLQRFLSWAVLKSYWETASPVSLVFGKLLVISLMAFATYVALLQQSSSFSPFSSSQEDDLQEIGTTARDDPLAPAGLSSALELMKGGSGCMTTCKETCKDSWGGCKQKCTEMCTTTKKKKKKKKNQSSPEDEEDDYGSGVEDGTLADSQVEENVF